MIHREKSGESRGERQRESGLQRCHVIEGMVQLLTNGLVLQLLSIQFVWRSEVDRKYRQRHKQAKSRTGMRDRWRQRAEGGREGREDKK